MSLFKFKQNDHQIKEYAALSETQISCEMGQTPIRCALPVDVEQDQESFLLQGNQRVIALLSYEGTLLDFFSHRHVERYPGNKLNERESLFGCQWMRFEIAQLNPKTACGRATNGISWSVAPEQMPLKQTFFSSYIDSLIPQVVWSSDLLDCTISAFAPEQESCRLQGVAYTIEMQNKSNEIQKGKVSVISHIKDGLYQVDSGNQKESLTLVSNNTSKQAYQYVGIFPSCPQTPVIDKNSAVIEWEYAIPPLCNTTYQVFVSAGDSLDCILQNNRKFTDFSTQEWKKATVGMQTASIGTLEIENGGWWKEFFLNHILRGANIFRLDEDSNMIGAAIGPENISHTVNREDFFRCADIHAFTHPELYKKAILFTHKYMMAPPSIPFEENAQPNVSLCILCAKYYRATGDTAFFHSHHELYAAIISILERAMTLRAKDCFLFKAEEVSDGHVLMKYDFCTNLRIWEAFQSAALVVGEAYSNKQLSEQYYEIAEKIKTDIDKLFTTEGIYGLQFAAATDLDKTVCFIDGEDNLGAFAPHMGFCSTSDIRWINYCRQGFSQYNPIYNSATGGLHWVDDPTIGHGFGEVTAPSFASRLAAATTLEEVRMELLNIKRLSDIDTTFYWYPNYDHIRGGLCHSMWMTSAVSSLIMERFLGIKLNASSRELLFAPWNPWRRFSWENVKLGSAYFSYSCIKGDSATTLTIANQNEHDWDVTFEISIPKDACVMKIEIDSFTFDGEYTTKIALDCKWIVVKKNMQPNETVSLTVGFMNNNNE